MRMRCLKGFRHNRYQRSPDFLHTAGISLAAPGLHLPGWLTPACLTHATLTCRRNLAASDGLHCGLSMMHVMQCGQRMSRRRRNTKRGYQSCRTRCWYVFMAKCLGDKRSKLQLLGATMYGT